MVTQQGLFLTYFLIIFFLFFLFHRRAVLLFSSIFSFQDLFSRFTAWIRNLFRVNAVSSVLSPPAVDEASVTKLASQKSLQFPNSSFSEYYMHVQFAFRVPPAAFQWNGVCVCINIRIICSCSVDLAWICQRNIFSAVPGVVGLLHFGTFLYVLQPFSQKISQVLLYLAFNSTF